VLILADDLDLADPGVAARCAPSRTAATADEALLVVASCADASRLRGLEAPPAGRARPAR
jgi:hypothetical protein